MRMVPRKGFFGLLVLFLGFSFVLSSVAVPAARSLKSYRDDIDPSVQDLAELTEMDKSIDGELSEEEGRMVLETTDYPGPGANNQHDPKPPGRV